MPGPPLQAVVLSDGCYIVTSGWNHICSGYKSSNIHMSVVDAEDSLGMVALLECEDLLESVHLLETFKKNPIDRSLSQDKCADQEGHSPAYFNQISDLKN